MCIFLQPYLSESYAKPVQMANFRLSFSVIFPGQTVPPKQHRGYIKVDLGRSPPSTYPSQFFFICRNSRTGRVLSGIYEVPGFKGVIDTLPVISWFHSTCLWSLLGCEGWICECLSASTNAWWERRRVFLCEVWMTSRETQVIRENGGGQTFSCGKVGLHKCQGWLQRQTSQKDLLILLFPFFIVKI